MPKDKEKTAEKLIPHFESEEEEIEFWDEHDLEEFDWEPRASSGMERQVRMRATRSSVPA